MIIIIEEVNLKIKSLWYHMAVLPFIAHLSKRFKILHRARQNHCRALCKFSKWYAPLKCIISVNGISRDLDSKSVSGGYPFCNSPHILLSKTSIKVALCRAYLGVYEVLCLAYCEIQIKQQVLSSAMCGTNKSILTNQHWVTSSIFPNCMIDHINLSIMVPNHLDG